MQEFSTFAGCVETDEEDSDCMQHITEFIAGEYLNILESAGYHVIYHHDVRWPQLGGIFGDTSKGFDFLGESEQGVSWDVEQSGEARKSKSAAWAEVMEYSDMCGFDMATAVSQTAINAQLHALWDAARGASVGGDTVLAKWKYQDCFEGNFQAVTVRLLSHGSAIIWIHLADGSLKALKNWSPSPE